MTTPGALGADLELMTAVAGRIDQRNAELRGMLTGFIGQMTAVPPTVWGGAAAASFRDVVHRWNAESARLHTALDRIAQTIRQNERALRGAAEGHAHTITTVAQTL